MDRRTFLGAAGGVSGSFVAGTAAGAALGVGGVKVYQHHDTGERSYAQQGEDLIVRAMFDHFAITAPTYLDVGAWDPIIHSNTYLLYQAGGHGVLVEPNPALRRRLHRVRPRDRTLAVGIGVTAEASADYYVIGGPSEGLFNTFSKQAADELQRDSHGVHTIEKVIRIPLVNINAVMAEHFDTAPNFLSIDTEGLDLDILKSMDFDRHRPDIVCVETVELGTDRVELEIVRLLESRSYSVRGATFANTIFVDDRRLSEPGPLTLPPRARR